MIALRVTLEEIILWVLEEEPVDCAAESTVRPHDSVERNLGLVSHSLQVIADSIDSLTEGMAVWEEDKSVGLRSMPDPFPLGEMKVSSHKRGEISHDEYFNELVKLITRGDEDVLDNSDES